MPTPSKILVNQRGKRLQHAKHLSPLRQLLLWAIAIAVIAIFGVAQFNGETLWFQIQQFSWTAIALSLGAVMLQILCQTARLWLLFPRKAKLGWQKAAIAFIRGQFIGNWVSTQAGYAVKVWHIRPQSQENQNISLISATAIVLLDKLLDVFLLAVLSIGSGLWLLHRRTPSGIRGYAALHRRLLQLGQYLLSHPAWATLAGLSFILVIGLIVWLLTHPSKKLKYIRLQLNEALLFLRSPRQTIGAAIMGIGDWGFEMLSLQLLCASQHSSLNLAQSTLCLLILNLGISIPSGIANVGAFEASLAFALTRFGLSLDHSLAVAVVYHVLQLAGITLWYLVTTLYKQKAPTAVGAPREKTPLR